MSKRYLILGVFIWVIFSGFTDPEFPVLPRLKSVLEYKEWANTNGNYEKSKWLKTKTEYYLNGMIKSELHLNSKGDSTALIIHNLNKDSFIFEDENYKKSMATKLREETYFYKNNQNLPYMVRIGGGNYKYYYTYDSDQRIIEMKYIAKKYDNYETTTYTYDTSGLLIHQYKNIFLGTINTIYEYEYRYTKNENNIIVKREMFSVPRISIKKEILINEKGEQISKYFADPIADKVCFETIFFNEKGERLKKETYNEKGNVDFIYTYVYQYY